MHLIKLLIKLILRAKKLTSWYKNYKSKLLAERRGIITE
jgi:hypothetical protein